MLFAVVLVCATWRALVVFVVNQTAGVCCKSSGAHDGIVAVCLSRFGRRAQVMMFHK